MKARRVAAAALLAFTLIASLTLLLRGSTATVAKTSIEIPDSKISNLPDLLSLPNKDLKVVDKGCFPEVGRVVSLFDWPRIRGKTTHRVLRFNIDIVNPPCCRGAKDRVTVTARRRLDRNANPQVHTFTIPDSWGYPPP